MKKIALLSIVLILTVGCSTYSSDGISGEQATFRIDSTPLGLTGEDTPYHVYAIVEDRQCRGKKTLARFSSGRNKSVEVVVAAGRPINIYTIAEEKLGYLGSRAVVQSCRTFSTFTPKPDHYYRISHNTVVQRCRIEVLDVASNKQPEDLNFETLFKCE